MAENKEVPPAVADGIPNLSKISATLKVLISAAKGSDFDYYELSAFQDITRATLETTMGKLDEIIEDMKKDFPAWQGECGE